MRGDQKLSSCWVYTFKRCDVIHLSAATPSTSPLFLVLLSLIFLVFGFLSFWLSHTSLWKPGDSVLPNQRKAHLSCALHLCVLSLEMTPFLLALLVPSDISEGWTGATVPPHVLQLLHISFSIFTTLEMSCFCGWWVKSIAQREKAKPPSMPFIFFYSTWQSLSICLIFIYLFFNSLLFGGVH